MLFGCQRNDRYGTEHAPAQQHAFLMATWWIPLGLSVEEGLGWFLVVFLALAQRLRTTICMFFFLGLGFDWVPPMKILEWRDVSEDFAS